MKLEHITYSDCKAYSHESRFGRMRRETVNYIIQKIEGIAGTQLFERRHYLPPSHLEFPGETD